MGFCPYFFIPKINMTYHYPAFTADAIITNESLSKIVLITRKNDPFKGKLAFPGGFLDSNETLKECCIREVYEETNIILHSKDVQFVTLLDQVHRDPRGRVISAVFAIIFPDVIFDKLKIVPKDDALSVQFLSMEKAFEIGLAFDHQEALQNFLQSQKK